MKTGSPRQWLRTAALALVAALALDYLATSTPSTPEPPPAQVQHQPA